MPSAPPSPIQPLQPTTDTDFEDAFNAELALQDAEDLAVAEPTSSSSPSDDFLGGIIATPCDSAAGAWSPPTHLTAEVETSLRRRCEDRLSSSAHGGHRQLLNTSIESTMEDRLNSSIELFKTAMAKTPPRPEAVSISLLDDDFDEPGGSGGEADHTLATEELSSTQKDIEVHEEELFLALQVARQLPIGPPPARAHAVDPW